MVTRPKDLQVTSALTHLTNFFKAHNTCGLKLFREKKSTRVEEVVKGRTICWKKKKKVKAVISPSSPILNPAEVDYFLIDKRLSTLRSLKLSPRHKEKVSPPTISWPLYAHLSIQ